MRIDSILYGANLTRAQMEAFMEKDISEQLFTQMHYHFDRWGPGGIAIEERAVLRGQDWKKITVGNFSAYLIYCGVKTASISVVTTDDDGVKVEIAKIISVEDKHKLIKDYQKLRKREIEQKKRNAGAAELDSEVDKHEYVGLSYEHMQTIVSVVCPNKDKCLAALVTSGEIHGRENFECIRELFAEMKKMLTATVLISPNSTYILKTHMDLIYNSDRCKSLIYNDKINHACTLIQHSPSKIWKHKSCMHSHPVYTVNKILGANILIDLYLYMMTSIDQ